MESSKADSLLESPQRETKGLDSTILLASGSSDPHVYLYDVGGPEGSGELVQKLDGHLDRVYSVCFHPMDPILASCSADFSIKIWSPKSLKFYNM